MSNVEAEPQRVKQNKSPYDYQWICERVIQSRAPQSGGLHTLDGHDQGNALLDEQLEALREGFLNKLDLELHRDGSHGADTVGGIDRAKASYRRNYAVKDITSTAPGNLVGEMEIAWRQCIKHGGSPDFIIAGGKSIDTYRKQVTVTHIAGSGEAKYIDAGVGAGVNTGLGFKKMGVEIIWDPQFDELDAMANYLDISF